VAKRKKRNEVQRKKSPYLLPLGEGITPMGKKRGEKEPGKEVLKGQLIKKVIDVFEKEKKKKAVREEKNSN